MSAHPGDEVSAGVGAARERHKKRRLKIAKTLADAKAKADLEELKRQGPAPVRKKRAAPPPPPAPPPSPEAAA